MSAAHSRVALTATGLAHTYQGRLQQIAWTDVVGVMRDDDGDLVVFAAGGQVIPVGPTLYKNGRRLVDAVLTHVAGDLVYEASAESDIDDHHEARGRQEIRRIRQPAGELSGEVSPRHGRARSRSARRRRRG